MNSEAKLVRIPSLKTVEAFREHVASLGVRIPCDDEIQQGVGSPLVQGIESVTINGKHLNNRIAIQPMEGWDGTTTGGVTDLVCRRWRRFGDSGAKLICGGEAMAVCPDGRANPNQLIISRENEEALASLREDAAAAHRNLYGLVEDLIVGFQLTHSGRFCRPKDKKKLEPRVAFRHPVLDERFGVTSDDQVFTDEEIEELIKAYVAAAEVARDAGADFVDIKHCHGYLLHEFLGAHTRPGKYGGSFENRTRILRDVIAGIRASGNDIDLAVRLSAFDFVPFRPDPTLSQPGKPGPGIPAEFSHCLPYRYGFGVNEASPVEYDLTETLQFADLCAELGVKILNLSAGSPYYNPHIQRPAAYPPSDGYRPPEDPLVGVARQMEVTRQVKTHLAKRKEADPNASVPVVLGSAYSYLQEYLPHVAQAAVKEGWTDLVGIGRMVLSYPRLLADAIENGSIQKRLICRTFSDCTTAPRNGLVSGCYPLDKHYAALPEANDLKRIKKGG